jgi:type I restriction enzyme S subunit
VTATNQVTSCVSAVWWKDLERWDVKFFSARVRSSYPVVRLAPLIHEHSDRVKPFDYPETTFRILGVTSTGGIFHAYDSLGKKINQPYQRVDAGDFAYNPYRVNVGSIGVVPTELGGNYISPAYVVFATDKTRLLPEYLILILKADWFNPMVRAATAGSVRQNLTFDLLGTLEIPLPPLAEQKAIVARWRKVQEEICAASLRVEELANGIQLRFLEHLGLKLPQQQEKPRVFSLFWKDFERWGIRYNQQALAGMNPAMGKYPTVYLRDAIADLENGWSPRCLNRPAEDEGWGVLKLGAVSFGLFNDRENKALPKRLKPLPMLEVKKGQVLISRANIPRLVGACAIVNETRPRLMLCDKIFRVVFRADSAIEPEYLAEVMKIPQVRRQIEAAATGTSATMQNITKPSLLALSLPLPPLSVQRQILREIVISRAEIAREREAANLLAHNINAEVKAMILGTKKVSEL